jgi:hypothetical protein
MLVFVQIQQCVSVNLNTVPLQYYREKGDKLRHNKPNVLLDHQQAF